MVRWVGMGKIREHEKIYSDVTRLKNVLLEDRNIDILLFLAKYNPNIMKRDIEKNFGRGSLKGLIDLEKCQLVREESGKLTLTSEGIFQVEGLITLVA